MLNTQTTGRKQTINSAHDHLVECFKYWDTQRQVEYLETVLKYDGEHVEMSSRHGYVMTKNFEHGRQIDAVSLYLQ